MNQHVTLTPSQLAFHQAAKERAWRKIEAARRNLRLVELEAPQEPRRDESKHSAYPVLKEPEWAVAKTRFDDHITAWRHWQRRQIDIAASPKRAYIKKRAAEMLITYEQVVSYSRTRICVDPRHLIIWEIKNNYPAMSYPEVGILFGIDHTSVLHAERRIQKIVDEGRLDDFISAHMERVSANKRSHKKVRAG